MGTTTSSSGGRVRRAAKRATPRGATDGGDERYRLLFELNPNPMFVWDEETLRFLAVNEAALRLYQWTRREFLRLTAKDIRPPEDVPAFMAGIGQSRDSRALLVGTWHHRKRDGTVFDAEVTISAVSFRDRAARLVLVKDVTERRRAEEALHASEERLRYALEAADMGAWEWDLDSDVSVWSAREYELLGLRPGEGEPSAARFLEHVHPEDRPTLERRIGAAVEQRGGVHEEFRVVHPGGEVRWLEARGRFLSAAAGSGRRMFGLNFDITGRKHLEAELVEQKALLERRVAERTSELRSANEALRREMARRRQLEVETLGAAEREQRRIGNDLHDGLCQITAGTVLLSRRLAQALHGKDLTKEARMARRVASLTASIAEEVRQLSHGLSPVPLETEGLASALRHLARTTTRLSGIPCEARCAEGVMTANHSIDVHLFRIAQEAVNNAVRHAGATHIVIGAHLDDGGLALTVADDGCGIPRKLSGSPGLGLQLMRHRAEVVGGSLNLQRTQPRGTLVTCRVPASVVRPPG